MSYQPDTVVDYPESDGQPIAECDFTRGGIFYAVEALSSFFQSHSQVYVSGCLFIYYEEGSPRASISPDVLVISGVINRLILCSKRDSLGTSDTTNGSKTAFVSAF